MIRAVLILIAICFSLGLSGDYAWSAEGEKPRKVKYVTAPNAPALQTRTEADNKSAGCMSCHTKTDSASMHQSEGVVLGCVDCHGGDPTIFKPEGVLTIASPFTSRIMSMPITPKKANTATNTTTTATPRQ